MFAFDHATSSGDQVNVTSFSFNFTVNAANKRLLIVCYGAFDVGADAADVLWIRYNGVDLIQAKHKSYNIAAGYQDTQIWYMINPPVGTYTLEVNTGNPSGTTNGCAAVASQFNGHDLNDPNATGSNGANSNPTVNITPTLNNSLIVDAVYSGRSSDMTTTQTIMGQVAISNGEGGGADRMACSYKILAVAGATTMAWVGSDDFSICAVAFTPSSVPKVTFIT